MNSFLGQGGGRLPRHEAGSATLVGGTGRITAMCPVGEFLEAYKVDRTFRIRTPESVDPGQTNPNAPWVTSAVADVGSGNLSVARVLLQSRRMLDAALTDRELPKGAIIGKLHECKEALVNCELLSDAVCTRISDVVKVIAEDGIARDNQGRGLNPFPQVANLNIDCGSFLVGANRAIKLMCELPSLFHPLSRIDGNFEHLLKRVERELPDAAALAQFLRSNCDGIRYLVDLRNYDEHQTKARTRIENFKVLANGGICSPTVEVQGDVSYPPESVHVLMPGATAYLRDLTEAMFIHLLMGSLSPQVPYFLQEIPEAEVDPAMPIRYALNLDPSQLAFMPMAPTNGSEQDG